jgi:transcriptional regulator with PAS, ATPase and Fis domain
MQNIYRAIFSNSRKMCEIKGIIDGIAKSDIAVLIQGETGTGKELLAEAIHLNSQWKNRPFVKVDYAAIQKGILQIKLFEFEDDTLTETRFPKPGKFEWLDGGTILLNNISEMNIPLQVKPLEVLQNGMFFRPGEYGNVMGYNRVIATTTDRAEKSIVERHFREGLFPKINFININVPPLRDRKEQILPLTEYYFNFYKEKYRREVSPFSSKLTSDFREYAWPGNIRELENVVERIVIYGGEDATLQNVFARRLHKETSRGFYENSSKDPSMEKELFSLKEVRKKVVQAAEVEVIQSTLQRTHWNRRQAAKLLGVGYNALLYKIQKYNLG